MNVQTERLDNHTARLTVELEPGRIEQAKQQAAQRLSKRYRIPGFRPGKAPYKIIASHLGEATILEDALEKLGDEIYKAALDASGVKPYGPGSLENFKSEPPAFVFTVPLQPEVDLKDYRSIRAEFKVPDVTEEEFERAMKQLQQEEALVEQSHQPARAGNRVTVDIHSHFADGEEPPEAETADAKSADDSVQENPKAEMQAEASASEGPAVEMQGEAAAHPYDDHAHEARPHDEHDHDHHDHDYAHDAESHASTSQDRPVIYKGDSFIHRHDMPVNLTPEGEAGLLPGFVEKLIGANVGDELTFELEIPDNENYKDVAGRRVEFEVKVNKIEVVTLPEMNDDFAARLTKDEDEPLTLLQLRLRVRENLQREALRKAEEDFSEAILDKIIAGAHVAYPEMMVVERIEELLKDLDANLRQQGLSLERYQQATGTTKEKLYAMYQTQAEQSLTRTLVLSELLMKEQISVSDAETDARIEDLLTAIRPESREAFRQFLNTDAQRVRLLSNMLYERIMERLLLIGKGEAPELSESAAAIEIGEPMAEAVNLAEETAPAAPESE